jgi:hypothetical protein
MDHWQYNKWGQYLYTQLDPVGKATSIQMHETENLQQAFVYGISMVYCMG